MENAKVQKDKILKKKPIRVVAIAIVVITILVVSWWFGHTKVVYTYYTEYEVKVSPNSTSNYVIYVPVPVDSKGNVSEITINLILEKGNASWEIISTQYGPALKVYGSGDIIISAKSVEKAYCYNNLSMITIENVTHHGFYCNGTAHLYCESDDPDINITIHVNLTQDSRVEYSDRIRGKFWEDGSTRYTFVEGAINGSGWQSVSVTKSIEVVG